MGLRTLGFLLTMIAVIQRVDNCTVTVNDHCCGQIKCGLLVLLGIVADDEPEDLNYIVKKTAGLRIFPDAAGLMNLDLQQYGGELLLVSQFTLCADTRKGNRPSFSKAAPPEKGLEYYQKAIQQFLALGIKIQTGEFGAHMLINFVNNGPVTIILNSADRHKAQNKPVALG